MMHDQITPVILCGGKGTRLWPLSRQSYPKQFISLAGEWSMLQETCLRLLHLTNVSAPIVICHEDHRFIVAEQLTQIGILHPTIILEPYGKNTAPAAAIAALFAPHATLLVLPSDHLIKDASIFGQAVTHARQIAALGYLTTFGMTPLYAETGYGYIKKSDEVIADVGYRVERFVEKPTEARAKEYIQAGDYYWNSGMFMFQSSQYLKEIAPEILSACQLALQLAKKDLDFIRLDKKHYGVCESISIDYSMMEKSQNIALVPMMNSGWSDLGSWDSVYQAKEKDENNNVLIGDSHVQDVKNSYLHAEHRLLAAVGVSDHIIIETADAVLVAHKDAAQDVKQLVAQLENHRKPEAANHRRVYRPWGYYESIDFSSVFQVKRISVKPQHALSLQLHQYRSEHWIILSGTAEVTRGDEVIILEANQSTYIPALTKHRLKNIGTQDLVLIEVQTGSYLGEDDIVRFEDNYGRVVCLSEKVC